MTTAAIPATQPLRTTLNRLAAVCADLPLTVGVPAEPGWLSAAAVFAPNSAHLPTMLAAAATAYQTTRRDVPASFLFHRYNWMVSGAAIGAYLIDRRLPDLDLANVAIHLDEQGQGDRIALVSGRFWAAADDPSAADPEAMLDPAATIGLGRVRQELERHFEPVIDAMRARAPLGKRAMWLSLADNLAWCLVEFSQRLQRPGCREAELNELLQAPGSRLRGGTRLLRLEANGTEHAFIERGSCCLSYKLPESERCATCPLLKPEQRFERLHRFASGL